MSLEGQLDHTLEMWYMNVTSVTGGSNGVRGSLLANLVSKGSGHWMIVRHTNFSEARGL